MLTESQGVVKRKSERNPEIQFSLTNRVVLFQIEQICDSEGIGERIQDNP